jgi:hypothetical protein
MSNKASEIIDLTKTPDTADTDKGDPMAFKSFPKKLQKPKKSKKF